MENEVKEDKKVKKEKQPKTIKQIIISRIIFIFIVLSTFFNVFPSNS